MKQLAILLSVLAFSTLPTVAGDLRIAGGRMFDLETVLMKDKTTRQVTGSTVTSPVFPKGFEMEGYEIHMGKTSYGTGCIPLFAGNNGNQTLPLGITDPEGKLVGTYLHGFLDNDRLRNAFLKHVREKRTLPQVKEPF